MAEKSGGGAQPVDWKCNNPACGKELPGAGPLLGMRVCPECNADQRPKDEHRCVHCNVERTDATHAIYHSKTCGPETAPSGALRTIRDTASSPTDPKPQPPSPKPGKRPEASKDKSSTATAQTVDEPIRSPNGASSVTPQAVILPKSTQSATPPDVPKPVSQPQNESSTTTPQPVVAPPVTGSGDPKSTPDATHPDQNGDKPTTGSSTTQTHTPVQESASNDSSGQELVIGAKPQEPDYETQQNTGAGPQLNLPPVFGTTKQEDADKDSVNKNGNPPQGNTMNDPKQDQHRQQQTSKQAQGQNMDLSDTSTHPLGSNADNQDNGRGQGKGGGGGGGESTATTNSGSGSKGIKRAMESPVQPQQKKARCLRSFKHTRQHLDSDQHLNPKHVKLSGEENVSYVAEDSASSSDSEPEEMVAYKKTDKQENLIDPQRKKTVKGSGNNGQSGNKSAKPTTAAQQPYDYKKHSDPNYDLKGLRSAPERSIAVTFHCIVPKLLWLWDPNSCIHMRFEGETLGNWKHNVGDFFEVQTMEEDVHVCEMVCTLNIDAELLKRPLGYKYVVFSPKMTKHDDCYEKLHPFTLYSTDDPDRCLWIPPQIHHRVYGGELQQYDMFVYPGVTRIPKSFVDEMKERGIIRGLFHRFFGSRTQAEDVEMKLLDKENMAKQCLKFYLCSHMPVLLSERHTSNFKLDTCVSEIANLFRQHHQPCIKMYNNLVRAEVPLSKEMKGWLEEMVAKLVEAPRSHHQFISAMAVACCIVKCHIPHSLKMKNFVIPLLNMLNLQPDIRERAMYLKDTPTDFRSTVISAIERLCTEAINSMTKDPVWDLLGVLPLYHFMKNGCEFMAPEYDPERINIGASVEDLNFKKLKNSIPIGFVDQHYSSLEPLFAVDPLLLHKFIFLCKPGDYINLFQKIPPYLSLTWLSSLCRDTWPFYSNDAEQWIKWLLSIQNKIANEECHSSVNAALLLVIHLFAKLKTMYYLNVLKMSITVLLFALTKVKPLERDGIFQRCEQTLKDWVAKTEVIGGSGFGASLAKKGDRELKLWKSILSLVIPNDENVTDQWNKTIASVIRSRVDKAPVIGKLNLVPLLEEESHPILSSALMEGCMQAIDEISSDPSKYSSASGDLAAFVSLKSEKVGAVFGRLLQRQYPAMHSQENVNISLEELLTWPHWPNFIRIYKGSSNLKCGLPEPCQLACSCVVSKLEAISRNLDTGNISIVDIQKIKISQTEIEHLWAAADEKGEGSKPKSGHATVSNALKLRIQECTVFEKQKDFLLRLCQIIPTTVKGISKAMEELQKDYHSFMINTLCRGTDPNIEVICFAKAAPLLSFAWKFDVMVKQKNSSVFHSMWRKAIEQAQANHTNMGIGDIEEQVWKPAFQHCDNLLDQVRSLSMTLSDVDKHFNTLSRPELELELQALLSGVSMCVGQTSRPNFDWICPRVVRIVEYRKLRDYCAAANLFLKLRDELNLTEGDFSDVERISAEVSSSMKNQKLTDINEELVEIGRFLSEFTPDKMECIRQFCECQDIVHWIRKTTKDVSDLQNFVNVALATAAGGEDDIANDRLSSLRTVGSGFSSLIYKLKKDTDFKGLRARCTSVWTAYRNDRNLPEMLASCNKDLEWYKSVKETQGSVEVTSFGQMDNIQKYGCYTVTGKRHSAIHSTHDVIQLTLTSPADIKLLKKSYSLDELRDLESKLVLITGSKAENRAAVEHFLDTLHCVCRIAEVLITLQQVGHVKYIGWRMDFYCQNKFIDDLQKQAKEMEDELEGWNTEVAMARKKFYELNYYTTHQLLVLRSELGKMKNSGQTAQTAQVMALLESISCDITPDIVGSTVHRIASLSVEDMEESDVEKLPIPQSRLVAISKVEPLLGSLSPLPINQPTPPKEHPIKAVHMEPLPQVSLTRELLNEQQSEHFTNIVNMFGYNEMTALKAIEVVGNGDWNDIENWVEQNADNFEELFQDHEGDGERGEEEEDENEEDEAMNSEADSQDEEPEGVVPFQSPGVSPSSTHSRTRVVVTSREAIDETNPEVQLLLDVEMGTPAQCINAIEKYGTAHNAMLKMEEEEEEDALFHGGTSVLTPQVSAPMPNQQVIRPDEISVSLVRVKDPYLKLNELGTVLGQLSQDFPAAVKTKRKFPDLKPGQPHLLVVPPEQVLRAALSLYMEDGSLPMPTPEEMLICDQHTTTEEVSLLWRRAVFDPEFKRIFCLVHAEKVWYQTADKALRSLADIIQNRSDYRLVIICSSQDEEKCPIISKLHLYRRQYGVSPDIAKYRAYLISHFTTHQQSQDMGHLTASIVDHEGSCVRVVSSNRAGMGKTLFITRMSDKLEREIVNERDGTLLTIPVHGPEVTTDYVMDCLVKHQDAAHCTILHFDISPSVLWQVDTILFSLLVQRGLCDRQGRVWRNRPTQLYAIEVTLPEPQQSADKCTIPERFTMAVLEMLPSVNCVKPKTALSLMTRDPLDADEVVMDDDEFRSESFQRVYQYLRRHTARNNLDRFSYSEDNVEGTPHDCLQVILSYCGVKDPSWAEIKHFVSFLDLQLQSCERSYFCNEDFVGDVMAGLKSFVVKFMIRMSRDFSTSSLRGEVAQENEEEGQQGDDLGQYQIVERKQWEQSSHPYIFFNQDRMSITFVGFMVTRNGDLIDPTHKGGVLERSIMTHQLYTGLKAQRVNFDEDYRQWPKHEMIQKISTVMGIDWPYDPDPTYVLTVDNLIKILAIQMRFRCGIPVVIMGETGCGKTRLIRFMCDLIAQGTGKGNMLILKVHGGTSEEDILKFLHKAEEKAKENRNRNLDTVIFFDEANTTEAIELIKEIMCDGRVHGNPILRDLKFIAACNPYRRHTGEMIEKLRSAGLGFYVRESDTRQRLGKVPLRELVYRVIDLPPSMRPLVYDFGQLNTDTERDYTRQIVHDHIMKHATLSQQRQEVIPAVARVLAWSQKYMRNRKDECSFVSLRDVERAMLVFTYFFDKMPLLRDAINEKQGANEAATEVVPVDTDDDVQVVDDDPIPGPFVMPLTAPPPLRPVITVADEGWMPVAAQRSAPIPVAATQSSAAVDLTRSLILAVSVCYHARLSDREEFEERIARKFNAPLVLSGGAQQFRNEIRWCQEVLLESMVLGENIARNAALRENVFMLAVCVDLRIPLFLVGKPGSSKSLAKAIVADSMRGQASQNKLLKSFKQVHMFSYQCSQLSTPQSVIEVFNTAKRFQKNEDTSKYVSVVVLDEVGLAEDSPNLPLKALHPLLEDGTEGADENAAEVVEREKRVAFIGISNWALDPAKMNRGVMVTRGDPDIDELVVSAEGICHGNDVVKDRLNHLFQVLAKAYKRICKRQTRQFFGLRDFYSLIKMLYWMCEKTNRPPTGPQLVHAIKRNFGGLKEDRLDPEEIFWNLLPIDVNKPPDLDTIPRDIHQFVNPDNTRRGLIKTSLKTKETSWHGENRYLLFLTENYAALEILKQYLQDREGEPQLSRDGLHHEETTLKPWEMEPFVLFGSSFPRDKEYTQVCRNINQIKICMEIGRTVILLNLENLYESLYDVLNQYYIHHGGNRYVDLGLQTHKVKCRVHDEFKLILIAEKTTVYEEFPTPLINRLEKHFVLYSSVLEKWQTDVLEELEEWIKAFSDVQSTNATFKEKDGFVGYQKDVAAAVVFQASSQLRKVCDRLRGTAGSSGRCQLWETAWQDGLLGEGSLEELAHMDEGSEIWREAVLVLSQFLLLQTTPPSALIRLRKSKLRGQREQFQQLYMTQHHGSIDDFLRHHLSSDNSRGGLLLQVTTHSHLLSSDEVDELGSLLEEEDIGDVHSFLLQEFDTELDFTSKVSLLFVGGEGSQKACLLIVQCDSGHINGNLIACARYRIYDMRAKTLLNTSQFSHITHVLFIVHLPVQATHSSFVGLQGDPWVSCHIDELRPSDPGAIRLEEAQAVPISELFYGGLGRVKPDLERQTSDFAGSVEGMAFEHMRSAEGEDQLMETEEEGERGEEKEGVVEGDMEVIVIEDEEEEETESGSTSRESQEEPMKHDEQQNEDDDVIVMEGPVRRPPSPPSSDVIEMEGPSAAPPDHRQREMDPVSWKDKSFSEMCRQCVRLNGCIQAAASRLQDTDYNKQRAAERVRLLINLIPRKPVFPLEPDSFYGILVSHIHRMLCEREDVRGDDDWILNEAMDINHLQTGGTFTNVLTRQLDAVIVPCFSEIIAFLDRNCNLNLLQPVQPLTPLSQFWLNICASQRAREALRFIDMVGTQKVPMKDEEFACEFPFSWLVIELLDSQWDNAQSTGGSSQRQLHRQLCGLVSVTPLGEILMSVQDDGQCEELYRRYIHDFVRSMHKCTHKTDETVQLEYQLVQDSLHNMVVKGTDFASVDGHISLVHRIAAVHVVYRASSECLHWFGQLTAHRPGILAGVRQAVQQTAGQDEEGMMLHLYAVDKVLQELKPPIEAKRESMYSDDQTLRIWLNRLREISNSVESTLNLPGKHRITDTARLHWQKIRAIQMFTEHIQLNHGNMITYAKRLNLILGTETDFLKCETVKKIRIALNNMHVKLKRELKGKGKDAKKQLFAIKKSCRNFFIEVVSGLCFGQSTAPDDDLVETLLNIVFTERGEEGEEGGQGEGGRMATRDLTPYKDDVKDEKPIIRSFLLQLLLEHDTEMVKGHLKTYFNRCQQALVGGVDVDQELCLLCIQCFEDAIDKEYSGLSLETKMEAVLRRQLLSSATETLTHFAGSTQQRSVSLEALDAVAKMRYALLVVAELLQLQVNEQGGALVGGHTHYLYGRTASILIEEARHACTNERINTIDATGGADTTGPIVYLLKLLVRGAGFSCLKKIVERQGGQLRWVVPQGLSRNEEEKTLDPFVIYDQVYTSIREEMSAAAYGRDYSHLEQRTAALQPQEIVPLLMSVYQVYTLSRASTQMSKQLLPETIEKMNDMIINCKTLPRELKIMARTLVSNEQGGPLAALQVSAGQPGIVRTLTAVVIHTITTLLCRSKVDLLCPLITLLTSPGDMARCYLPTVAEDLLPEARRVITGGRFYECPNGHAYFVGECGRPVMQAVCNICGSAIGGQNHRSAAGNRDARIEDNTQTGHALGHPTARSNIPSPERSLSPAACCIVRAIMHAALLWCSCNNDTATEGLLALVKTGVRPQELPEFFWGHLERDIQLLARALGKNQEEAAIVVHLVVQNILTTDPGHDVVSMRTLGTQDVRAKWEEQFGRVYLHPLLERLEATLRDAMGAILNDVKQEHDPLFYLVYERVAVVQGSLEPHLWGYRPRITLEHLTRYMQQQKKKFPILKKFLQNEAVLRATQYLPDIVLLQRRLFDTFHHRIDRKVARTKTVQEFIQSRHSENVLNEYREMVTSVQRAWNLVRDKLREHTAQFKLKIEDEWLQIEVNPDTPLDFFIPTTTGPGVCTFALTHYLAYIHNNFIDWCRAKCKNTWHEHKIRLPHIHTCHLLDYHTQLQSILLSHCRYSLRVGHGNEVSYDLPALEKHILDRFIHGKPRILVDIPQVSYQKDVYTAATFAAIRRKVYPQIALGTRVQMDILRELASPEKLRKSLDVVEIVLGFLTSGGGKSGTKLLSYLRKLKMEKKTFSEKAKEHCNLEHILSLWQTLSVGLARVITLSGQEPFHTLNHELLEPLSETQCQNLDRALPRFDLSSLLGTLYEFIETYIRHIDMAKKDWTLLDTLRAHLEANNLQVPAELDELPDDITLAQTVATWKFVVNFQAKQRQE